MSPINRYEQKILNRLQLGDSCLLVSSSGSGWHREYAQLVGIELLSDAKRWKFKARYCEVTATVRKDSIEWEGVIQSTSRPVGIREKISEVAVECGMRPLHHPALQTMEANKLLEALYQQIIDWEQKQQ